MSVMMALQGLLPLIVFALVDIFAGMRAALIAAMVIALAEAGLSYYYFGEVDQLTWISLGLILVMGGVSVYMKDDRLFKFQPVALSVVSAGILLYFQVMEEPLLVQMMPKVIPFLPEEKRWMFDSPTMIRSMMRLDALLIGAFMIHAALVAWAAVKRSTFVWLIVRGAGFYGLMIVALLINGLLTGISPH